MQADIELTEQKGSNDPFLVMLKVKLSDGIDQDIISKSLQ